MRESLAHIQESPAHVTHRGGDRSTRKRRVKWYETVHTPQVDINIRVGHIVAYNEWIYVNRGVEERSMKGVVNAARPSRMRTALTQP